MYRNKINFALEDFLKTHKANIAKQNVQQKTKRSSSVKKQKDNHIIAKAKKPDGCEPSDNPEPGQASIGELTLCESVSLPYFPVGFMQSRELLEDILSRMFAKTYPAHVEDGYTCKDINLPCHHCKSGCEHCNNQLLSNQYCTHNNGKPKDIDELFETVQGIDPRQHIILIHKVYQDLGDRSKLYTVSSDGDVEHMNAVHVGWIYITKQSLTSKCNWRGLDKKKRQYAFEQMSKKVSDLTPNLFNEKHSSTIW